MISNTLDHVGIYASTVASMTLAASVMLDDWDDDKYNAASAAAAAATAAALQPIITIGIPTGPYLDKTEVKNNVFGTFGPLLYFKTRSFYQDRLGTNIAKAQKEYLLLPGRGASSVRSRRLPRHREQRRRRQRRRQRRRGAHGGGEARGPVREH